MAALSGALIQFAKNNDYTGFEQEFLKQNPNKTATDAAASFNGHQSVIQNQKSGGDSPSTGIGKSIGSGISSVLSASQSPQLSSEFIKFDGSSITKLLSSQQNIYEMTADAISSAATSYAEQQTTLLTTMNRELGMTGELSKKYREDITDGATEAMKYGVGFKDTLDTIKSIQESTGKFTLLSSKTIEEMGKVSNLVGGVEQIKSFAPEFEKVGLGVSDMSEIIKKNAHSALELGLNGVKMSKTTSEYLGKINEYGFKNGVEGLNKMVQKSTEFRMNMSETFTLAEKVMDPSGAIDIVANLQMIGGAFGDMNDPLKLMYMATNNVEGLQDAIIGSAKSLATYNQEQGRFEITGANIRRAKEMSNATGISYKELTNTAIAAQERLSATADLMANGLTFKNEGDKEFLTNLAHMKDGKMVIDIPSGLQKQFEGVKDGQLSLENMSQKQIDALLEQRREFEKKSDTEIIQSQLTVLSNISTNASYILEILKNRVGRTGQKAIETKLGLNTQDVNATMAKYSSMAANTIKDTDRKANEYFFGKENDINKPKPKGVAKQDYKPVDVQQKPANNNQTTQESKQTNENVTIQMEIKANDSHVDNIKRTLIQSVTAEDIRSYLHSHKKK